MTKRIHIVLYGAVQGVGFRPFVFRLAKEMDLPGWVLNSPQGVFIEVEGPKDRLDTFLLRLEREKPPRAFIQSLEFSYLDPVGFQCFEIRRSEASGAKTALVLPDVATCPECLKEILDPGDRRHRYPFTNCTNCGPRFTIIESLPYDRPNTTMKHFIMCRDCQREYEDPLDRRFHAQPNACPACGPILEFWDEGGNILHDRHEALLAAVQALHDGKILALKGLGGFHLMVDARNEAAVLRLRSRKHREEKPFALMSPSLESVKSECRVSELEERLLLSPESPIVLLERKESLSSTGIASSVAPHNPYLGVILPYSPLHHLLMKEVHGPLVATSGNLSDEPICIDEREALQRLRDVADVFLVHNRPIVRHVDDSVVRVMLGRELVLRRARGYAPLPVTVSGVGIPLLAVGGHLKNTVAMTSGNGNAFISQHIGDLETGQAFEAFRKVIGDFRELYNVVPKQTICDLHPDYLSTKFARENKAPVLAIQHHYAHVAACMAENELQGPLLGVSWDGTGLGLDGTIWGGEFLRTNKTSFDRVATFRGFRLPGGARSIQEPRRTAIGLLYEMFGDEAFSRTDLRSVQAFTAFELSMLHQMLKQGVHSPETSSAGRLFDAVSSLSGLRQRVHFEGQAAMELEFAIGKASTGEAYPFRILNPGSRPSDKQRESASPPAQVLDLKSEISNLKSLTSEWPHRSGEPRDISHSKPEASTSKSPLQQEDPTAFSVPNTHRPTSAQPIYRVDWEPLMESLLRDLGHTCISIISAKFHNTMTEIVVEVARRVGEERVVLSGGCFQNKYLTERTVRRLEEEGFRPYWHQRVPPNDGGIALGQIAAASRLLRKEK